MGEDSVRLAHGWIETVPEMCRFRCRSCRAMLGSGDRCFTEDDSSSIYCVKCIPVPPQMCDDEPERESLWMAYEKRTLPKHVQKGSG